MMSSHKVSKKSFGSQMPFPPHLNKCQGTEPHDKYSLLKLNTKSLHPQVSIAQSMVLGLKIYQSCGSHRQQAPHAITSQTFSSSSITVYCCSPVCSRLQSMSMSMFSMFIILQGGPKKLPLPYI